MILTAIFSVIEQEKNEDLKVERQHVSLKFSFQLSLHADKSNRKILLEAKYLKLIRKIHWQILRY